jgi:hypothetical protein
LSVIDASLNGNKRFEKIFFKLACKSKNFDVVPPIFGIIVGDCYGNILMFNEFDSENNNNYGSLEFYLLCKSREVLSLVPSFFSAFIALSKELNLRNMTHLEINSSNIKIRTFFLFKKYTIIVFLNSNTIFFSNIKSQILDHFYELLQKYDYEFSNFNFPKSRAIIHNLELKGKSWLEKLNSNYMNEFREDYSRKHENIDMFIKDVHKKIIQKTLREYCEDNEFLTYESEFMINNISREIKNKIEEKLYEFASKCHFNW